MEFAVIGHLERVDVLPVNLLIICHALQMECMKSIESTIPLYLLSSYFV